MALSPGCSIGCNMLFQTEEEERNANRNGRTMADLSQQPTSCEPDYLQTRDFSLSLSHSNLLCAFTLKQSNLYFDKSLSGFCNWLPSDWTCNVLLERMKHTYSHSRSELYFPSAEMKLSLCCIYMTLSSLLHTQVYIKLNLAVLQLLFLLTLFNSMPTTSKSRSSCILLSMLMVASLLWLFLLSILKRSQQ